MAGFAFSAKLKGNAAAKLRSTPRALRSHMHMAMEKAVILTERDMKLKALRGSKGSDPFWGVTGAAGDAIGVRSGQFVRTLARAVFFSQSGGVVGTVGSPLKRAHVLEHGGTINGKPYLRIPTRVMQTGAGVDRLAGQSARVLQNTAIIRSKKGNLWIAEVGTARARLAQETNGVPLLLYMLVRKVRVRARHMFSTTLTRVRPQVRALFSPVAALRVATKG